MSSVNHEYEDLFIRQLEKLRQQKGVSQREMSLALGQTEGYISKLSNINSSRHLPRMMNFFWICEYLGVHPKDFFDEEIRCPIQVEAIVKDLSKLSDEQLFYLSALVKDIIRDK